MIEINIKKIEEILENMDSLDKLKPYKDLGNGLYKLPGNIICNKKGLDVYLKALHNEICNFDN
jgi:hypothetical protein